uniref:Uncharacterized protein n=1 Tax=Populus trichocarpa TaxID=3694 RepID=B9IP89_POPTR
MVLKYVKLAIGFRFLEASQAVITFIDKESMEKELTNGCSARLEKLLLLSQTMEEGNVGKMIGYDITSMSQGSLIGVKALLSTTSFMTLNERTQASDEELCSEFTALEEFTVASTKATDPGGHTGSTNSLDHTDATFKTFCLFPEIKEIHNLQTKNQQLHTASHQPSFAEPCYDDFMENTQEAEDSHSNPAYDGISDDAPELLATNVTETIKNTSLKDTSPSPVTKSADDEKEDKNPNYASMDEEASETQEMIDNAVALALGNPRDLKVYEEGIRGNIDKEVDEWTSIN